MDNLTEHFQHDICPGCGKPSIPLEGTPDQSRRGCGQCGREWFEDLSKAPTRATAKPERTANSAGFYVDGQAWELAPKTNYRENPPDDWEDCDQCGGAHPAGYTGDCRSNVNRWPSDKCIAALTGTA